MKILFLAMSTPALMLALGLTISSTPSAAQGEASQMEAPSTETAPLNQIGNIPEIVATARVTDLQGKVIGTVQMVEIRNGRPARIEIALLGNPNAISVDAATLRYDAANNVVTTGETAAQLLARAAL